ncbi:28S ribosomal protein L42, mitochondrial [Lemmus lemmus]
MNICVPRNRCEKWFFFTISSVTSPHKDHGHSSEIGDIKQKYLETFISNPKWGVCHKSTNSSLPDDYNCKVELTLTSDGQTIVCFRLSVDIPSRHLLWTSHPDILHNNEEIHKQVLKIKL